MITGATKTYSFGNKNNWRRWYINRVVERLVVHRKNALVLYLGGANDLDRKVFVEKGFHEHNLIVVEKDKRTVGILRRKKSLTIKGDILDAMYAWPHSRPIDVVVADFCGDLTKKLALGLVTAWGESTFRRAIFVLNFQRGRAKDFGEWRQLHARAHQLGLVQDPLHRGEMAWQLYKTDCRSILGKAFLEQRDDTDSVIERICSPSLNAYMSGNNSFDSVVFRSFVAKSGDEKWTNIAADEKKAKQGMPLRRNIAAVLAHRTMRLG